MTTYSLTGLLDMTLRMTYGCGARALFISYMVPSNRVVRSPENKPQHALNAKVMYNDCSLSRCKFYNHLPGAFREKSVAA